MKPERKRRSPRPRSRDADIDADPNAPAQADASSGGAVRLFVVDRREGNLVVVIDDTGRAFDVDASLFQPECRAEGAVLRVPLEDNLSPIWKEAVRDRDEEHRRTRDYLERIERLRKTDPGGDVVL